jgi:hypothetical protein
MSGSNVVGIFGFYVEITTPSMFNFVQMTNGKEKHKQQ